MNAIAMKRRRFPNHRRKWNVLNESAKRVKGTSTETKENADKTRRKKKRLLQVLIMRSQLMIHPLWDLNMFIKFMMHSLKSKLLMPTFTGYGIME